MSLLLRSDTMSDLFFSYIRFQTTQSSFEPNQYQQQAEIQLGFSRPSANMNQQQMTATQQLQFGFAPQNANQFNQQFGFGQNQMNFAPQMNVNSQFGFQQNQFGFGQN